MQDVHVRLTPVFLWQMKRSTKGKYSLHQQNGRQFKDETNKVLHLEHCFEWGVKLGHFGD